MTDAVMEVQQELTLNVDLLRQIADKIKHAPSKFNMEWLHSDDCGDDVPFISNIDCGTAHCIIGTAAVILNQQLGTEDYDVFGLSWKRMQNIAFVNHWPEPYRSRYEKAKQKRSKALIAVELIHKVIETNGAILDKE